MHETLFAAIANAPCRDLEVRDQVWALRMQQLWPMARIARWLSLPIGEVETAYDFQIEAKTREMETRPDKKLGELYGYAETLLQTTLAAGIAQTDARLLGLAHRTIGLMRQLLNWHLDGASILRKTNYQASEEARREANQPQEITGEMLRKGLEMVYAMEEDPSYATIL